MDGWMDGWMDGLVTQRQTLNTTNDTRQLKPAKRRVYSAKQQNELEKQQKTTKKYLIIKYQTRKNINRAPRKIAHFARQSGGQSSCGNAFRGTAPTPSYRQFQ
jgi:SpoVK/Ycf46/Vps4 family AAA+-type ATPase